ncbi:Peptidase M23B [Rhodospirillum rubrum ATCC 11170]|uniref:Peptidase M23B n=1 Tax=Rhodospirillum rubrum (strain ATCC 11170 / ATH 1.1.1 / DSM 467 / LMG 4362 / NCIMB 8255 / S1) TaxID=269796 RepID=Q2RV11_RHORT|nr:Peptidase M23B [Rhodospirillum rubrum ATCC 11170]
MTLGGLCLSPGAQAAAPPAPPTTTTPKDLKAVETALEREARERERLEREAAAAAQDIEGLGAKVVASARRVQDHEETLSTLEIQLADLRTEDKTLREALARRDIQVIHVLTAVQRLAWRPTEALLVQPAPPADTVRGAILLRAAIPRIEQNARDIVAQLKILRTLDTTMRAQRAQIRATSDSLRAEHTALREMIDRKSTLAREIKARTEAAADRMDQLAREAKDIRDLMARLEEERIRREAEEKLRAEQEERAEKQRLAEEERLTKLRIAQEERDRLRRAEAERLAALAAQAKPAAPPASQVVQPAQPPQGAQPAPPPQGAQPTPPPQVAMAQPTPPPRPASLPRTPPPTGESFERARGAMPFPARGPLVGRYGERTPLGDTLKGVRVVTRGGGQVVSPHEGTVVFAGPFRGYGNLLIIDHGGGYHTLLAGLGRIDGVVGQRLAAGEPVGIMPDVVGGGDGSPTLYVELRRKGQPINPLPWLTASKGNASG